MISNRDDGLRSLRCCKRRSVISNLRGFGHKWASSRLRVAIIHPEPIRSDPCSTYLKHASSSDLALAAVAGLSLQGHSVSLYTSGFKQKDIPEYVWESTGDVKSCIPRILRLALFPSRPACVKFSSLLVSVVITIRVMMDCLITFLVSLAWSILPSIIQRARGGVFAFRPSKAPVLDVVITFGDTVLPHAVLSRITGGQIVHFPLERSVDDIEANNVYIEKFINLKNCSLIVATTDFEAMNWNRFSSLNVCTVYPPVTDSSASTFSALQDSAYFLAIAWYPDLTDVLLAIESFSVFLSSTIDLQEGSTGSGSLSNLPCRLVVAGVESDHYSKICEEIHRCKLVEGEQVLVLSDSVVSRQVVERCIAVIHTPSEINQVRIPCAAMLASRPVISTTSFSVAEPVRHESTGIIVKSRSPQLVAEAIAAIYLQSLNKPGELVRMGLRGKQRILTEFSFEMFGSRLDDALIANRHKNSHQN